MRRIGTVAALVIALGLAACGSDDDETSSGSTTASPSTETTAPAETPRERGEVDALTLLSAFGPATPMIDNAIFEGETLVLLPVPDPSVIDPEVIKAQCAEIRDSQDATRVVFESPDGTRTPVC